MATIFKQIFKSYNFNKNYIKDAYVKTDEITENKHIVNKEFVDKMFVYNTELSHLYNNSLYFSFANDLDQNTISQLFDKLLFPNINPIYYETNHEVFKFSLNNFENNKIIYYDNNSIFDVCIHVNHNDRPNTTYPSLLVTYDDDTYININRNENHISLYQNEVNFNFVLNINKNNKIKSVKVIENVNPTNVTKQNTYGEPYTDPLFENSKIVETDITNKFKQNFVYEDSILCGIFDNEYEISDIPALFESNNLIEISANEMNMNILIPSSVYNNKTIMCSMVKNYQYSPGFIINKQSIYLSEEIDYNGTTYKKCFLNMGYVSYYDHLYFYFL